MEEENPPGAPDETGRRPLLQQMMSLPMPAGMLAALFLFLPLMSPYLVPFQLLVPLPLMLVALQKGYRTGWMATWVLLAVSVVGQGNLSLMAPLLVLIFMAGFPLLAAWFAGGGWSLNQCGSGAYFAGAVLLVVGFLFSWIADWEMASLIESRLATMQESFAAGLRQAEGIDPKRLLEAQQWLAWYIKMMSLLFPGLFMAVVLVVQVGNLYLARRILNRWGTSPFPQQEGGLDALRVPEPWIWPLIISIGLGMFTGGGLQALGLNMAIFLAVPYFLQGMAVIQTLFRRYRISAPMRAIFYVMLLIAEFLLLVIAILGLFDTWFNFRGHMPQRNSTEDSQER